jgi:uncharacterized protein YggE
LIEAHLVRTKNQKGESEVKMLKRVLLVVVIIALLVPVGLAGVWLWGQVTSPAAAQTSESTSGYSPAQTITVVGQGETSVKPDIARISIGVETSGESVADAVTENETAMAAVLAALEASGIDTADIQTTNYSVQLDRSSEIMPVPETAETAAMQYRVSNMVNVIVRDLDATADVLDAVIEAGANNIWGVTFSVEDPSAAQADARAAAMADAQSRAEALAELGGVELGPVMSISEVVGSGPVLRMAAVESAFGGGTISPGELDVSYQVQVSYFIAQ